MRFKDKVVLVTEAGGDLGRMIALAFAKEGALLSINDLTPVNLDDTERLIITTGSQVFVSTQDVSKKMQVQSMIEATREQFGALDILINSAEVQPRSTLLQMDEWDWDRTLAVNLKGPFLTMQSAGRIMRDQGGGVIINLGRCQLHGQDQVGHGAYVASKDGLVGLTRTAALELARDHIRVNAVCPGILPDATKPEGVAYSKNNENQMHRSIDAMVETVLYLCSDAAEFITGEVVHVKGVDAKGDLWRAPHDPYCI